MAESSKGLPPPYTPGSNVESRNASPAPTSVSFIDPNISVEAMRASILDNAPVLWMLGHGGQKPIPGDFTIATVNIQPGSTNSTPANGGIRACIMFSEFVLKRPEARLFVQGSIKESMTNALISLLQKTQDMIGKRWHLEPQHTRMVNGPSHLQK